VEKSEVKRPQETPKRRWNDNIKMDLRDIAWSGTVWNHLAQGGNYWRAFVNMVTKDFYLIGYKDV
jgi:hypothetical protein